MRFGFNGSYPFDKQLTGTPYVINGYSYLSHPNDQPSYGGQPAYETTPWLMVDETVYYGPEQADTSLEFWRLFFGAIGE